MCVGERPFPPWLRQYTEPSFPGSKRQCFGDPLLQDSDNDVLEFPACCITRLEVRAKAERCSEVGRLVGKMDRAFHEHRRVWVVGLLVELSRASDLFHIGVP